MGIAPEGETESWPSGALINRLLEVQPIADYESAREIHQPNLIPI